MKFYLDEDLSPKIAQVRPHTIPGDQFSRMARLIKKFSSKNPSGLEPYAIAFLPLK
jgi:hypothetical protein